MVSLLALFFFRLQDFDIARQCGKSRQRRDVKTLPAIKKTAPQYVGAQESPGGTNSQICHARAQPVLLPVPNKIRAVRSDLRDLLVNAVVAAMFQLAGEG